MVRSKARQDVLNGTARAHSPFGQGKSIIAFQSTYISAHNVLEVIDGSDDAQELTETEAQDFNEAVYRALGVSDIYQLDAQLQLGERYYTSRALNVEYFSSIGIDPVQASLAIDAAQFRATSPTRQLHESPPSPQCKGQDVVQDYQDLSTAPMPYGGSISTAVPKSGPTSSTSQLSNSTSFTHPPPAVPKALTSSAKGRINSSTGRIAVAGNGYGDDLDGRPPVGVQIPQGIQIGAIEILTFFPRWLHHPDVILRLFKAGWRRNDIAKVQLHAVNQLTYHMMDKVGSRTQKQLGVAGKLKLGMEQTDRWNNKLHLPLIDDYNSLALDGLKTRHDFDHTMPAIVFDDFKLADIAAPIMGQGGNWPRGAGNPDRLQMTQILEFAFVNPHLNLSMADVIQIVQQRNIVDPGFLGADHDTQALQRFNEAVFTPAVTAPVRQTKRVQAAT